MKRRKKDLPPKGVEQLRDDLQNLPGIPPGSHLSDDEFVNYVMEHLSEKEVERIDRHLAACEPCAAEMERLLEGAESWSGIAGEQRLADVRRKILGNESSPQSLWINYRGSVGRFAVAAVVLILFLFGIYWLSLPPYYQIAELTVEEQKSLALAQRSEVKSSEGSEHAQGAAAMLNAHKTRFGFFPYFDAEEVDIAISRLHDAWETSAEAFDQNQYAFFLGKAYLMQANADSARYWFRWVADSRVMNYKKEAHRYLEKLPQ